ncbi:MAG TPA: hypothetical protein VI588_02800, partial [Candidatus Gracilibacteria bacterium]|nr:hypothetical protein [Candidatus Gracilibacteria bacterium]
MIRVQKTERIKTNRPRANMILLGAIVVGIALTYATKHLGPLIFLGLVAALIRQGMISIPATEFASQFKKKIVPEIIKFFGDFEYKNTAGISIDIIKQSDLFDNFNQSYFGDTVTGRYHGKSMEFAETTLSNKSGK